MSCRASPPDLPNSRHRHSFVAGSRRKTVTGAVVSDGLSTVKTEPPDDDMKDYAETAMNELLGWYGYDKVSSVESRKLGDSLVTNRRVCSSSSSSSSSPKRNVDGGQSPKSRTDDMSEEMSDKEAGSGRDTGGTGTPILDVESLCQSSSNTRITCAWCLKNGLKLFTLKTAENETKAFCSELCFDQCRRANFKKNRVCDWCKHVRHTVSYVDFQDKDHQLQFCSDKCLNQYKMNIFCKETQAYLQMHPHLKDGGSADGGSSSSAGGRSNLITPDLWLKDCKESTNGNGHGYSTVEDDNCASSASMALPPTSSSINRTDPGDEVVKLVTSGKGNFRDTFRPEIAAGLILDHGTNLTKNSASKYEKSFPERTNVQTKKPDIGRHADEYRKRTSSLLDSVLRYEKSSRLHKLGIGDYMPRGTRSSAGRLSNKHGFAELGTFNQLSPPPAFPPPLINGSLSSKRMTSTRSRSSSPMPPSAAAGSPGLPPPPPLLSGEMLHSSLMHHPQYQTHQQFGLLAQQQFEAALLASHSNGRFAIPTNHRSSSYPIEAPQLPASVRTSPLNLSATNSLIPPATVMLPYPLVVPMPVPIPIPIPIPLPEYMKAKSGCQKVGKSTTFSSKSGSTCSTNEEQGKRVDSIVTKLMTKHQIERQNSTERIDVVSIDQPTANQKPGNEDSNSYRDDESAMNAQMDFEGLDCSSKFKNKRSTNLNLRERTKRTRIT